MAVRKRHPRQCYPHGEGGAAGYTSSFEPGTVVTTCSDGSPTPHWSAPGGWWYGVRTRGTGPLRCRHLVGLFLGFRRSRQKCWGQCWGNPCLGCKDRPKCSPKALFATQLKEHPLHCQRSPQVGSEAALPSSVSDRCSRLVSLVVFVLPSCCEKGS